MMTNAAMVSTMGTARGTTHGSCRPLAARTPDDPSYRAVACSCEIVAGGLNAILSIQISFCRRHNGFAELSETSERLQVPGMWTGYGQDVDGSLYR